MIGQTISHYRILEKLGEGGMGVVYKAEDTKLKRLVALKFLPPELTRDAEAKERFIHEAQAASALDHPNVCTVFEIGETDDGQMYMAMAYYEGETLKKKIEHAPLPIDQALDIAVQIGQGLSRAHEAGIVHRDVKSANVIVTNRDEVKIVDFGLAKLGGQTILTKAGTTMGTVAYMSPEQTRGEKADHRSDIWSLGVVIYEMIVGRRPFQGEYDQSVMYSIMNEEPQPMTALRTGVPMQLEQIVNKALAKSPDERYQHADEMVVDLKKLKKESETRTVSVPTVVASKSGKKDLRRFLLPVGILVLLVLGFFLLRPIFFEEVLGSAPVPVAVITFENQTGDQSYDYLQKAIPNLLITNLERSKYIQVMTWERMQDLIKQMGKKDVAVIDKDLGFELCRREGVNAIILGTYTKAGEMFAVDVKVLEVDSKKLLGSANSKGEGVASILKSQIDELTKEISQGVGLSKRKVESEQLHVAEVTTTSMDAYNYFLRGREEFEKFDDLEAAKFLEKAVGLDSTFAMAYLYLARCYGSRANTRARNENLVKAKAFAVRASEKERLYIEAWYAEVIDKDLKRRFEILKTMEERFPKEKRVYAELGIHYRRQGMYKEAFDAYNKALALDPNYGYVLNDVAYAYGALGEYGKAIEYLEKYASVNPGDANPFDSMGDMYFYMGDMQSALAKYKEAVEIKGYFLTSYKIAFIYALYEDYPTTLEWIDRFRRQVPSSILTGGLHAWKSYFHHFMGERRQALRDITEAQRVWGSMDNKFFVAAGDYCKSWILLGQGEFTKGTELSEDATSKLIEQVPSRKANYLADLEFYRGLVALRESRVDEAVRHVVAMEEQLPDVTANMTKHYRYLMTLLHGAVLLAQGKTDSAIAVSIQAVASGPADLDAGSTPWYTAVSLHAPARDVLARAYVQKGQMAEAIAEYERLSTFDPKREDRRFISPEYHYYLGKLYEQTGQRERAIQEYEKLLKIWKNGDSDLRELIDTKARLARLKATGQRH
jgi:serine/threonine protein kinase/tetratricopeptide (TPR) repeat protein